jgi:putative toxin-antitoxin system antitoxin component (TIGR02293 family)
MSTAHTEFAATPLAAESRPEPPSSYELAGDLLGGHRILHRDVRSDEDAHELVSRGIPAAAMAKLFDRITTLSPALVLNALGVSERSFARRKAAPQTRLPLDESGRLWRFAEILGQATRVFGSQEDAEQWLGRPAIGLNRQKPIDLLRTPPGARLVAQHLTRIEDGIYT